MTLFYVDIDLFITIIDENIWVPGTIKKLTVLLPQKLFCCRHSKVQAAYMYVRVFLWSI